MIQKFNSYFVLSKRCLGLFFQIKLELISENFDQSYSTYESLLPRFSKLNGYNQQLRQLTTQLINQNLQSLDRLSYRLQIVLECHLESAQLTQQRNYLQLYNEENSQKKMNRLQNFLNQGINSIALSFSKIWRTRGQDSQFRKLTVKRNSIAKHRNSKIIASKFGSKQYIATEYVIKEAEEEHLEHLQQTSEHQIRSKNKARKNVGMQSKTQKQLAKSVQIIPKKLTRHKTQPCKMAATQVRRPWLTSKQFQLVRSKMSSVGGALRHATQILMQRQQNQEPQFGQVKVVKLSLAVCGQYS